MALPSARMVRMLALIAAIPSVVLAGFTLWFPDIKRALAYGPLIDAHTDVDCVQCHVPSRGTVRQQIQAKTHHLIGLRESSVDFGYQPVTSTACLACHARPNERHPIYRFNEPRFSEAVRKVDARSCLGCHSEHGPQIVDVQIGMCSNCHTDIVVKNDPIDIKHDTLIRDGRWESCLTCHDFHGNHAFQAPLVVSEGLSINAIRSYLVMGNDPYGSEKLYKSRQP
ncbi:hypothetical protein NBRC116594_33480 [Shimia sp. NS0008-38b]|uniref:hypothetical protein n=1 Tax=Shimia sp. NS0008-38b TaxID=3127653 RepID=UPI00310727DA